MRVRGNTKTLIFAVFAAILPFASNAADKGFYLGAGLGANWTRETDITGIGTNLSADFDAGWVGALSMGWAYGNGLRSEIEFGYRRNDLDSLSGAVASSGDASSW